MFQILFLNRKTYLFGAAILAQALDHHSAGSGLYIIFIEKLIIFAFCKNFSILSGLCGLIYYYFRLNFFSRILLFRYGICHERSHSRFINTEFPGQFSTVISLSGDSDSRSRLCTRFSGSHMILIDQCVMGVFFQGLIAIFDCHCWLHSLFAVCLYLRNRHRNILRLIQLLRLNRKFQRPASGEIALSGNRYGRSLFTIGWRSIYIIRILHRIVCACRQFMFPVKHCHSRLLGASRVSQAFLFQYSDDIFLIRFQTLLLNRKGHSLTSTVPAQAGDNSLSGSGFYIVLIENCIIGSFLQRFAVLLSLFGPIDYYGRRQRVASVDLLSQGFHRKAGGCGVIDVEGRCDRAGVVAFARDGDRKICPLQAFLKCSLFKGNLIIRSRLQRFLSSCNRYLRRDLASGFSILLIGCRDLDSILFQRFRNNLELDGHVFGVVAFALDQDLGGTGFYVVFIGNGIVLVEEKQGAVVHYDWLGFYCGAGVGLRRDLFNGIAFIGRILHPVSIYSQASFHRCVFVKDGSLSVLLCVPSAEFITGSDRMGRKLCFLAFQNSCHSLRLISQIAVKNDSVSWKCIHLYLTTFFDAIDGNSGYGRASAGYGCDHSIFIHSCHCIVTAAPTKRLICGGFLRYQGYAEFFCFPFCQLQLILFKQNRLQLFVFHGYHTGIIGILSHLYGDTCRSCCLCFYRALLINCGYGFIAADPAYFLGRHTAVTAFYRKRCFFSFFHRQRFTIQTIYDCSFLRCCHSHRAGFRISAVRCNCTDHRCSLAYRRDRSCFIHDRHTAVACGIVYVLIQRIFRKD